MPGSRSTALTFGKRLTRAHGELVAACSDRCDGAIRCLVLTGNDRARRGADIKDPS